MYRADFLFRWKFVCDVKAHETVLLQISAINSSMKTSSLSNPMFMKFSVFISHNRKFYILEVLHNLIRCYACIKTEPTNYGFPYVHRLCIYVSGSTLYSPLTVFPLKNTAHSDILLCQCCILFFYKRKPHDGYF